MVLAMLAVSVGCPHTPDRIYPPSINASAAGAKAIEMYDANKDGALDYQELAKAPGLRAAVGTIKKLAKFRHPPPPESELARFSL